MNKTKDHSCVSRFLLVTALYFVAGKLSLLMAIPPGYATAVWPASGFALAGLLLFGYRLWPSIWLGSVLVNFGTSLNLNSPDAFLNGLTPALIIGLGASLQAVAGAWLIRKFLPGPITLIKEKDVCKFLLLAGPVSCLTAPTIGTLTLLSSGAIKTSSALFSWWTWWVGDSIGVLIFAPLLMVFFAEPAGIWRARRLPVGLPMVISFALTILLFVFMKNSEQRRITQVFKTQSQLMTSSLQNTMARYLDVLYSLQSFYNGSADVSREEFTEFTRKILERYPAFTAMEWDPMVTSEQREAFEQNLHQEGFPDFAIKEKNVNGGLQVSARRDVYFPITYAEPFQANAPVLGYDFTSEPSRQLALKRGWESGELALTRPVSLIQGPLGVIAFLGIYDKHQTLETSEERIHHIKGFVVVVFKIRDIIEEAFRNFNYSDLIFFINDVDPVDGELSVFAYNRAFNAEEHGASHSIRQHGYGFEFLKTISLGGRTWQIEAYPTSDYLIAQQNWNIWFILAGGLLWVGLLGGFLLVMTGRELLISQLVADRTLELQTKNRQLEQLSSFQTTILDYAGTAIIATDLDGMITVFNRGAEKMLGYKAEDLIGKKSPAIFHDQNEIAARAAELSKEMGVAIPPGPEVFIHKARKNIPNIHEWTYIRKDGSTLPVLLSLTALRNVHGEMLGFIGIASDITVQKKAEEKLIEAVNVKSDFTSMVSHELRTPLTVIKESINIVYDGTSGPISEDQKDFLATAKSNVDRLARLINDVLDHQKLEINRMEFRMETSDLNALVGETGDNFKLSLKNKGLGLDLHLSPDLPHVKFDRDRILQVLTNLMSNAMKFTEKGTITLSTEKAGETAVKVSVRDQGIGIRDEDKEKLFQRFSQISSGPKRKTGGTGLGLAVCKKIIENHKGTIGVESTYGRGSNFYFILPVDHV